MYKMPSNKVNITLGFQCPECSSQVVVAGRLWDYLEYNYDNGTEKVSIDIGCPECNKYIMVALQ